MKYTLIFLFQFSLLFATDSFSQEPQPRTTADRPAPFREKLFYGGSLGLQFGTYTLVDVSPLMGYKLTERIGIGVSPTYKYFQVKNFYSQGNLKTNVFGGSIFGRILIFDKLFAHTEYEYLIYNSKDPVSQVKSRLNFQSVFVGAGYREPVAQNAFMYLLVLWNLNETIDSPYTNPVIRAGFTVGF